MKLEIRPDGKFKLVDEDPLESIEIILLIENEHGFLVVNGIHGSETQGTIATNLNRRKNDKINSNIGSLQAIKWMIQANFEPIRACIPKLSHPKAVRDGAASRG